jgi:methionyl-tRNA formyltransferase
MTTMFIEPTLDTGPILLQAKTTIGEQETAPELMARLAETGADLLGETLMRLSALAPLAQDDSAATFAPILKKEDGAISWNQPAKAIHDRVRGLLPWPGAHTRFRRQLLHIWRARVESARRALPTGQVVAGPGFRIACGDGNVLELLEVQLEGRKRMSGEAFANGQRLGENEILGEQSN